MKLRQKWKKKKKKLEKKTNIGKPAFASLMWLFEVLSFYTKRTQSTRNDTKNEEDEEKRPTKKIK